MYTPARPPTPALCYEIDPLENYSFSDDIDLKDDVKENDEDALFSRTNCDTGRILIGRWGRCHVSRGNSDPPEIIVNQARLHTRPSKPFLHITPPSCKRTKFNKEVKKPDKKILKEQHNKLEKNEMESAGGRLIASKVLPIMAMLLQRNESYEEETKKSDVLPSSSHTLPKLSVQCIQLLPSEPATTRRH